MNMQKLKECWNKYKGKYCKNILFLVIILIALGLLVPNLAGEEEAAEPVVEESNEMTENISDNETEVIDVEVNESEEVVENVSEEAEE